MKITKIKPIGYCKGVYQAINTVYDVVKQYPHLPIYCMGQIVHNDFINHQFEKLGVHIITKNKMQFLHSIEKGVVIFSAHGTSQDLLKKAQEKNLIVINTICPYVLKEMNIVQKYVNEGFEILYIGKKNHPEAEAICSISANIHLIETMEDAKKFQINHSKLFLTNQSTLSITNLYEFFQYFKKKYPLRKYLVKNIRLYLIVTAVYIPISIYSGNMPKSILEFIKQLLFDGTFYHLWYFPAAIIGCVLLACLTKKSVQAAVYFSLIAYVIGVFGDSYYGLIENVPLLRTLYTGIFYVSSYTRNGIFFAPIYILLGMLLAVPEFHCGEQVCKWGLALASLLMLLEGWITYSFHIQKHNSMYFFLLPVMYFLFQLLLKVSGKAPAWIRNGSMMLYIIHPAVIVAQRLIAKVTGLTKILVDNSFFQYISVCLLSLAAMFIIQIFFERGGRNVSKR